MATVNDGALTLTRREARILRRAQHIADQLDAVAQQAAIARDREEVHYRHATGGRMTPAPVTSQAVQRPAKAPAWLQRLIVRRATRTRPQEAAAFALGVGFGAVLVLLAIGAVSEAAR